MPFDQYHEPANELSEEVRTFARMIMSMIEEADAIDWYEQRMSVEKNAQARAIMEDAQGEEFKHFGMDLEFVLRQKPTWRATLQGILFKDGDIVQRGKQGEQSGEKTTDEKTTEGLSNLLEDRRSVMVTPYPRYLLLYGLMPSRYRREIAFPPFTRRAGDCAQHRIASCHLLSEMPLIPRS